MVYYLSLVFDNHGWTKWPPKKELYIMPCLIVLIQTEYNVFSSDLNVQSLGFFSKHRIHGIA